MARTDNYGTDSGRTATADDVRHVVGQLEDLEMAHILSLQPTYRELTDAALWARGDGDLAARESRDLSAAALAVANIIAGADEATEAEDG